MVDQSLHDHHPLPPLASMPSSNQSIRPPHSTPISTQSAPKIPPTFDRWFWTSDYRRGVSLLFDKLNAGLRESAELIAFIRRRESYERAYAHHLRSPTPIDPTGFGFDDGASFLSVFKQLCASQVELADAHARLAVQLDRLVIAPFESWSREHDLRLSKSIAKVDAVLVRWEKQAKEVARLKDAYDLKTREADDAEDDSRFSPAGHQFIPPTPKSCSPDPEDVDHVDHTLIGQSGILSGEGYAQLGKKVGEQAIGLGRAVSQRMRIGGGRVGFRAMSIENPPNDDGSIQSAKHHSARNPLEKINTGLSDQNQLPHSPTEMSPVPHSASEKGKAKADQHASEAAHDTKRPLSIKPASPQAHMRGTLLDIAGVIKQPIEWSRLFEKAHDTVYKQSVKIPLLGTYSGAHSGEDLVIFFKTNLPELDGKTDRAIEFCRQLAQELSILRLIGEIGNKFMATHDAFYMWKPDAFTLHEISPVAELDETLTALPDRRSLKSKPPSPAHSPQSSATIPGHRASVHNPAPNGDGAEPSPGGKRLSGAVFTKYLQTAVSQAAKGINELSATVGVSAPTIAVDGSSESRAERLRREAQMAEKAYSTCVVRLDHTRLVLEQTISEHMHFLQRCELDRLRAAKAVIMGFNAALATLNPKMSKLAEDAVVLNESFSPESDVCALVERYRTGPFRPAPVLFHGYRAQEVRVNFGIDLGKWHNTQNVQESVEFLDVPPVLTRLLRHLVNKYPSISSHNERRKAWIYEVPLKAVHDLREALNNPSKVSITDSQLASLDAPLIAATVKLWLLELDPPPVQYSRYDDVKAIYPHRAGVEAPSVDARVDVLAALLSRLPKPHLMVIDAVVGHLRDLVVQTRTSEDEDVFLMKLGLSVARTLIRPKVETAVTLSDRFQPLFLIDLIKYYDRVLPAAIGIRKKMMAEAEERRPQRKHTRPVDMRVRRSELGIEGSVPDEKAQEILEKHRRRISQGSPGVVPVEEASKAVVVGLAGPATTDQSVGDFRSASTEPSPRQYLAAVEAGEDGSLVQPVNDGGEEEGGVLESTGVPAGFDAPVEPAEAEQAVVSEEAEEQVADGQTEVGTSLGISKVSLPPTDAPLDDTHDAPFVPPSQPFAEADQEPIDMPFVPPSKSSLSTDPQASRAVLVATAAAGGVLDDEDIPLAAKASLGRLGSGAGGKVQKSSLSRKRGVVGSPRMRSGSKLGPAPSNNNNNTTGLQAQQGAGISGKSSSSFDSLRSQFEMGKGNISRTEKSESHGSSSSSGNRYRRAGPPVIGGGGGGGGTGGKASGNNG